MTTQSNETSKHTICFVALPFGDRDSFPYESVLRAALRKVLELAPYYWQVGFADDMYFKGFIYDNVGYWLKRAHVYIADISDLNHNVMMEFGYMFWAKLPEQPLIVLQREGTQQHLADIESVIRTQYPAVNDRHAVEDIAIVLEEEFDKMPDMRKLRESDREHYLSSLWLQEYCHIDTQLARAISKVYVTMEAFEKARAEDIQFNLHRLNLSLNSARSIKGDVAAELKRLKGHN